MKAQLFFLFNIEGYGEFFSGITPGRYINIVHAIVPIEGAVLFELARLMSFESYKVKTPRVPNFVRV